MPELFVFDGYIDWSYYNREYPMSRVSDCKAKIENAIKSLALQNSFLRRNLRNISRKEEEDASRTDNIRKFLLSCLENGHDRTDPNKWNRNSEDEENAKAKGLKANDIIWARQYFKDGRYHDDRFCFYNWDPEDYYTMPNDNDGILIMNGQAYIPEQAPIVGYTPILFSQPNVEIRKKALLGIILFDNALSPLYPRPNLRFRLSERTFPRILGGIQEAGYFVD